MNRGLINRVRRIESENVKEVLGRHAICPIPHGEQIPEGWKHDLPMTHDEWEALYCNAPRS